MPPSRSSGKLISSPAFRKAYIWRRSTTVWPLKTTSSKIDGSGQNVTVVPLWLRGEGPTTSSLPTGFPPLTNSIRWCWPSRSTSTMSRRDRALTTDTPTPWRPPETLYPVPPNLPPP